MLRCLQVGNLFDLVVQEAAQAFASGFLIRFNNRKYAGKIDVYYFRAFDAYRRYRSRKISSDAMVKATMPVESTLRDNHAFGPIVLSITWSDCRHIEPRLVNKASVVPPVSRLKGASTATAATR